jgi:hypothetical protein
VNERQHTIVSDSTVSHQLLEPALPGIWMAEHRRIWQLHPLNASKFASFSYARGLSFDEKDIIQLWQLGLIKADLVTSRKKLRLGGLIDRGIDRRGYHMYSDERPLPRRLANWKNARKTLKPLRKEIELLFHPFRYYVLYHISRLIEVHVSSMQTFLQEHFPHLLEISLTMFNNFSQSDKFTTSIDNWNDVTSLCILTEPYIYQRIFHSIRYDPTEVQNWQVGAKEINQHITDYWHNNVEKLYLNIGVKRLEEIRQDLCVNTQLLDPNRWIHTLLCLGESELRLELEGHLGGALLLRTMAEMLRRATEEVFDNQLREEDELGLGWMPEDVKETIYGSNRLLDNSQAGSVFARRYGLNYKPHVHLYGEGNTEYGALNSFFKTMGIPVTNLHGLIKEGKSMVTFFRDSLRSDIRDHMYSLVVIDGDVPENVKIMESAARNNQTSEEDGIFGRFFLSQPDFEIANFEIEELEEVLWIWVGGESPSQADREQLHSHVKDTTGSTEFFKGVKHAAALSLPQLVGYDKCAAWGEELMKFAWEHPFKQNRKRQIIEAVELAVRWEKINSMERYEVSKKSYMVDPKTGDLVTRPS